MKSYSRYFKFFIYSALIVCLTAFMAGCGSNDAKDDTVRLALSGEPASLDPGKTTAIDDSNVELQIFEGLTRMGLDQKLKPGVAESWEISPDGLVYTFHLRHDAKWSDGEPVTAKDFVYAWKRVLDPKTASQNAYLLYPIKNAEEFYEGKVGMDAVGIKALDDYTFQVTLKAPTAYFLAMTAKNVYYPVPKHVVEKEPEKWASEANVVGNGPFMVSGWVHSNKIEFKKNDNYWDKDKVKLTYMVWPISESQVTRLNMVESGEANIALEPPISETDRLKKEGIYHVAPYLGTYYYEFNVSVKPFDNVKVRKALSMAIDREALVKNVIKGDKTPAYAFVPPGLEDPVTGKDFREEGGKYVEYNPEKAKQLLAEAGYPDGNGFPQVTLLYNTNEMHKAVAEAIQAMWKQNLNIDIQLVNQETKVYFDTRNSSDFMICKANWIGDYLDPLTFVDVYTDPNNESKYKNQELNNLVRTAQNTDNQQVRMDALHKAEKIFMNDAVIIPIYYVTQPYVAKPYVKNYTWGLLGDVDFKEAYIQHD